MDFFRKAIRFLRARYAPRGARQSFSQAGEDLVIDTIFAKRNISKPFYIDIGAHDPIFGNNTYLFYRAGGKGVLIEPNLSYTEKIKSKRPKDICINAGVGGEDGEREFFAFKRSTRSTFSKEQAEDWQKQSGQKPTVEKKRILSLNTIVRDFVKENEIDMLSIDTEGLDVEILESYNWSKRPKIICVEYQEDEGKIMGIMKDHGYMLVAKIFQNAVFADSSLNLWNW